MDRTALAADLARAGYLADDRTVLVSALATELGKPVLVEGPAGVGKTELAKALAQVTGRELVRLQCYEGLDEARALYEWNYRAQLLRIQAAQGAEGDWDGLRDDLFAEEFLLERPLLRAIRSEEPVVLLVDEIDKADQEFEALLLELLSDFQVSIPSSGRSTRPPAARHPHLQRCARAHRGAQAPLPLPHARLPEPGARARHPARACPRAPGRHRAADRRGRAEDPRARSPQAAGHLRDDRLGPHAVAHRSDADRPGGAARDPARRAQAPHDLELVAERAGVLLGEPAGRAAAGEPLPAVRRWAARRRPTPTRATGARPRLLLQAATALRAADVPVGSGELLDASRALLTVAWDDEATVREVLAATLVKSAEHRERFLALWDELLRHQVLRAALDAQRGLGAAGGAGTGDEVPAEGGSAGEPDGEPGQGGDGDRGGAEGDGGAGGEGSGSGLDLDELMRSVQAALGEGLGRGRCAHARSRAAGHRGGAPAGIRRRRRRCAAHPPDAGPHARQRRCRAALR